MGCVQDREAPVCNSSRLEEEQETQDIAVRPGEVEDLLSLDVTQITLMRAGTWSEVAANHKFAKLTMSDLFAYKTVVLFGVQGPCTGLCSERHVQGFLAQADKFRQAGVDEIVCLARGSPYTHDAWGKALGADEDISFVVDHSGRWSEALGVALDLTDYGITLSSLKYALIAVNGIVQNFVYEDDVTDHAKTSAEAMLEKIVAGSDSDGIAGIGSPRP